MKLNLKYKPNTSLFTCTLSFFIFHLSFSQSPEIEWQADFGGLQNDIPHIVLQTSDGGYLIGGNSDSENSGNKTEGFIGDIGLNDLWIMKIDSLGVEQWQNTIGTDEHDYLTTLVELPDGYLIGSDSRGGIYGDKTIDTHGWNDYWILKLDLLGNIVWQKSIGGGGGDMLHDIEPMADGGFLLAGYSQSDISGDKSEDNLSIDYLTSDIWLVKINSAGDVLWDNTIGGGYEDAMLDALPTADGGFIIAGYSSSSIGFDKAENTNGFKDYWVFKVDSTGEMQWQNTIGGNNYDYLNVVIPATGGGYLLGGTSNSEISGDKTDSFKGGITDYWVVAIDSVGNKLWDKTYGGDENDDLHQLIPSADGGYLLIGSSGSGVSGDKTSALMGYDDIWIIKIDTAGNILWQDAIGGDHYENEAAAIRTNDGGLAMVANSWSGISYDKTVSVYGSGDYWFLKFFQEDCTGLPELCNGIDDNCNGTADEGLPFTNYYQDLDHDLYGNSGVAILACAPGADYVADSTDCNDGDTEINPGHTEWCNGFDDDCDLIIDEEVEENITISPDGIVSVCAGSVVELSATYSGTNVQWMRNGINIPGATSNMYTAFKRGMYSCVTYSDCDTTISYTLFVHVNKNPLAEITAGGPTTFCAGDSVILSANTGLAISYQWYKDLILISGATGIDLTVYEEGSYTCKVTKAFTGCSKMSDPIIVTVPCRLDGNSKMDISIYPNPAIDIIYIDAPIESYIFSIFDLNGNVIRKDNSISKIAVCRVNDLPSGMYFIRISSDNYIATKNFIKQ